MGWIQEFQEFAFKGSVIDLAVGVIIGSAFGNIVSSLVKDVLMPPLGLLMGNMDFSSYEWVLREKNHDLPAVTLRYGQFFNNLISFFIVALCIFLIIRQINSVRRRLGIEIAETKECRFCKKQVHANAKRCPHCTSKI